MASQCRFCGYDADPDDAERARTIWGISGLAATLTIIGAPIGLLLLWKAYQHNRATTGRVVDTAYPPTPFPLVVLADCRRTITSIIAYRRKSN